MNYKKAVTMTTLSVIAVFAIISFSGSSIPNAIAQTTHTIYFALQPSKMVFVENISPTVEFTFRDGTETTPVQQFTQTGGFGTSTMEATTLTSGANTGSNPQPDGGEKTSRSKPSFFLEKIVGGTPHLYKAADEAQKYIQNPSYEFPYKYFDATVHLGSGTESLRSFEYRDCRVLNYLVITRSDNEEGYTGKGFVYVDQFSIECDGYTPLNPGMDKMKVTEKAKTISSSDLKSTDKWEPGFSVKP
jgi:hypothetical protein